MTISLFVPSFNAAKTLKGVIERIPEELWPEIGNVYLIDDGSTDTTLEVMRTITRTSPRCTVVSSGVNCGYGETVKKGLSLCRDDGCAIAVCLHADGQYPPESIGAGVERIRSGKIALLQGSRVASGTALSGGMPVYKYVCGRLLTMLENAVFRLSMSDYHSGFLLYSRKVLENIQFEKLSGSFDFDLEVIAAVRAAGCTIDEFPIPTRYADEVSYLNPVTYGIRVLGVLGKYLAGTYRSVGTGNTTV